MRFIFYLAFCLLLVNTLSCYSQNQKRQFNDAYVLIKSVNSIGLPIPNRLPFVIISFLPGSEAEIFLRLLFTDSESKKVKYKVDGNILEIKDYYVGYNFEIVKRSKDNIVLSKDANLYYFTRIISKEKNYYKVIKDSIFNSTVANDTVNLYFDNKNASYKGDLIKFIQKGIPKDLYKDTSYVVNVRFIIRKDGSMDSINIQSDIRTSNKLDSLIKLTKNKWEVAEINNTKFDQIVRFSIFINSNSTNLLKLKGVKPIIEVLYNKGLQANDRSDFIQSMNYFSECEKLYDCYCSIFQYSRSSIDDIITAKQFWIDSIMNEATIFHNQGKKKEYCEKCKKVATFDQDALQNYIMNCQN